jgi:hypothetical protein
MGVETTMEDTVDMAGEEGTETTDMSIEDKEAERLFCSPHISVHSFRKGG